MGFNNNRLEEKYKLKFNFSSRLCPSFKQLLMFRKPPNSCKVTKCKGGCKLCKNHIHTGNVLKLKTGVEHRTNSDFQCLSRNTVYKFKINQTITCSSGIRGYYILDAGLEIPSCIGRTIDTMTPCQNITKVAWLHNSSMKLKMTSTLYCVVGMLMLRSRAFQSEFDRHLIAQLKCSLIDCVDLSSAVTTKEKRVLIESHEGYWRTQFRTLNHYVGLKKNDERKISNKRLAY